MWGLGGRCARNVRECEDAGVRAALARAALTAVVACVQCGTLPNTTHQVRRARAWQTQRIAECCLVHVFLSSWLDTMSSHLLHISSAWIFAQNRALFRALARGIARAIGADGAQAEMERAMQAIASQ